MKKKNRLRFQLILVKENFRLVYILLFIQLIVANTVTKQQ